MLRVMALVVALAAMACAQGLPAPAPSAPDAAQIAKEFGPAFSALPGFPVLVADLDGDGAEDAVVVATSENPLLDELGFHYKVIDPYHAFFGFGDPKVTTQFAVSTGKAPRMLLIVHNWRAPRAKFVIVNLPFDKLSVSRVLLKKKVVPAIRAEEIDGTKSALYWDGKKWKWKDLGIE